MNRENHRSNRRRFLLHAGASVGAAATVPALSVQAAAPRRGTFLKPGDRVLFQGDSITDARRDRTQTTEPNTQAGFGEGYAWMAASQMLVTRPELRLSCFNRGISGNKVFQLAERWQVDCLDLKPTVVSILVGVNDLWHKLNGNYDGTVEDYENSYHELVGRTCLALPGVRLVICEPFALNCGAVNADWFPEFDGYRAAAKRVAERACAVFVPFQDVFDRAIAHAPPEHWAADGVHPTAVGSALMARAWLRAVGG